jgi:hypothetical protein
MREFDEQMGRFQVVAGGERNVAYDNESVVILHPKWEVFRQALEVPVAISVAY